MQTELWQFGVTAFTALLVVVDPVGMAPLFVALTRGRGAAERSAILRRSILIAFGTILLFVLAGRALLHYLGITLEAFSISGGILLFATSLPMLFGQRPQLQEAEGDERGPDSEDISIFPLAIPLLAGPGTITTSLLLVVRAESRPVYIFALIVSLTAVFAVSYLTLSVSQRLVQRIGQGGVHVATRVLGILLAALAVQFVLNGIAGYYRLLVG